MEPWFVRSITNRMVAAEAERDTLKLELQMVTCIHCEDIIGTNEVYTSCDGCERNVCVRCDHEMRSVNQGEELYCIVCQTNQCGRDECIAPWTSMCENCEKELCENHTRQLTCICGTIVHCDDTSCKLGLFEYMQKSVDICDGCHKKSCRWHGFMECTCKI